MSSERIVPVPAVNAVILNAEREVLLTRRSKSVREPGKWCLPGGHVEWGESWEPALRREVSEEVGIVVKRHELVGIYSDPSLTVTAAPVREGYHAQFVVALYLVTEYEESIAPNEEVDDWDWFTEENLPEPMLKSHPIRVRDALRFHGEVFVR